MMLSIYFVSAALIQFSSAQVLSYVQRNSIPQQAIDARYVSSATNAINNALATPTNAVTIARVPATVPVANNVVATNAINAASNANNIANINAANAIANQNIANNYATTQNLANANYVANYANVVNQNAANAVASNAANAIATNAANAVVNNAVNALASNVLAPNYVNAYPNQNLVYPTNLDIPTNVPELVNAVANSNSIANVNAIANANLNNAALAKAAIENINGNVATFNLGTNGNTFSVTSGSPGAPGFGISVIADALEVGGTVAVNGQIPIFGSVAVNGNVPTDGAATVTYNCGGKEYPIAL